MDGKGLEAAENGAPVQCERCGRDITGLPEGTVVVQDGGLDEYKVYCDRLCSNITGRVQ